MCVCQQVNKNTEKYTLTKKEIFQRLMSQSEAKFLSPEIKGLHKLFPLVCFLLRVKIEVISKSVMIPGSSEDF